MKRFWVLYICMLFAPMLSHAQAIFSCNIDTDCQMANICATAYSINKNKLEDALHVLKKDYCSSFGEPAKMTTHEAFCNIDKQCDMRKVYKSVGLVEACNTQTGVDYENCVMEEAYKNKDVSICEGMGYDTDVEDCKSITQVRVIADGGLTEDFCYNVEETMSVECWSTLAAEKSRPELCFELQSKEGFVSCLGRPNDVFRGKWEKLTPNICEAARDEGLNQWADSCLLNLAIKLDDVDKCTEIESHSPFYKCYLLLGIQREDPELCRFVGSRGGFPANYPKAVFSENGCRYGVGNNGDFSGLPRN